MWLFEAPRGASFLLNPVLTVKGAVLHNSSESVLTDRKPQMCHRIGGDCSRDSVRRTLLRKCSWPAERLVIGSQEEALQSNRRLQAPPGGVPLGTPPHSGSMIDPSQPSSRTAVLAGGCPQGWVWTAGISDFSRNH